MRDKIEPALANSPTKYPKLKGRYQGFRRARFGNFRVVFRIVDNSVEIATVSHRKEFYI